MARATRVTSVCGVACLCMADGTAVKRFYPDSSHRSANGLHSSQSGPAWFLAYRPSQAAAAAAAALPAPSGGMAFAGSTINRTRLSATHSRASSPILILTEFNRPIHSILFDR